ncbi:MULTISPECIES: SGNH/GDSL hydrolase family protein [Streptomyces]|uniref:SGNH/GDSL hydrolase family protein n=1 Tax=Streptomyces TaxID=1883 RepID=UPI00101148A5|nr:MULTISPECIES: SGNH/GDSL hydrolase family protein [unclassified Streptomyces]MDT0424322.1 SGNH/GDSL hydrolase family protein [Streptomyces sp. DSM 41859]
MRSAQEGTARGVRPLSRRGFLLVGAGAAAGVAFGARPAAADVPGESNGGVRVMPLGDSLTDGFTPCPGGYRIGLWRRLAEAGYTVDFVGSLANGPAELGDHDHEGHSGWRIDQLDAQLDGWLAATSPRTVLLLIGTNDLNQNHDVANAPARLSALVDRIRALLPDAEIFVASVPPQTDPTQQARVVAYNQALPGALAGKDAGVHLVRMYEALTTADLADGVHLTPAGYDRMAGVWFDALRSVPGALEPVAGAREGVARAR